MVKREKRMRQAINGKNTLFKEEKEKKKKTYENILISKVEEEL